MSEPTYDEETLDQVLEIYADAPMPEGDAALLLDHKVCVEIERLATEWDEALCRNTALILPQTTGSVIVAIAPGRGAAAAGLPAVARPAQRAPWQCR